MIVSVGVDIVSLERIRDLVDGRHGGRFLERTFAPVELAYCLAKPDPVPSLAARFAAKEAFQKCWPDLHGWLDVWVEFEGVKPVLRLSPALETKRLERGWGTHVSLSHEREHAIAYVVLEERPQ